MKGLNTVLYVYGGIIIVGGIIGYAAAGSIWSLVTGLVAGDLIILLTYLTKTKPAMAYRTLGIVVLALAGFWAYRIYEVLGQSKSPMMAIGNLALAIIVFGMLGYSHFAAVRAHRS